MKRKRPPGYTVAAILMLIMSAGGLILPLWSPLEVFGINLTFWGKFGPFASSLIGLAATWALWTARPRAAEAYAVWSIAVLGVTAYYQVVVLPRMIEVINEFVPMVVPMPELSLTMHILNLVVNALFLALGYWYLVANRPATE